MLNPLEAFPASRPPETPRRAAGAGFRHFFSPRPIDSPELSIRGMGLREYLPPCMIERPEGTEDFLLMLFHDPAFAGTSRGRLCLQAAETMIIWAPGVPQSYGHREHGFSHSWVHGEGSRVRRILRGATLPLNRPFRVPDPSPFQQCIQEMHAEMVSFLKPDAVIIGNCLENGLREIRRQTLGEGRRIRVPESLLAVRRFLDAAPAGKIRLVELAAMAGTSVPHFCARFKANFGLAPIEYLIQQRMFHAARLLADRDLRVTDVAERVGYDDLFHFSKTFKKHFGTNPRDLRQRKETV